MEARDKVKKSLKSKLRHEADPEMDFIFWSRFEKEVEGKSMKAKLWAPLVLLTLLGLVFISAYFQQQTS